MHRFTRYMVFGMAAVLIALLACLALPMRAYASERAEGPSARVRVFQEYKVSTSGLQTSFDYRVVAQESDAPLPTGADGVALGGFALTRDDDLWLTFSVPVTALPEDHRATFHYLLEPVADTLPDGLCYVDVLSTSLSKGVNRYNLTLNVAPASEGSSDVIVVPTVHVEGWDGPKVTDPGWRVAYEEPSSNGTDQKDDPSSGGASAIGNTLPSDDAGNRSNPQGTAVASARGADSRSTTAQTEDPTRVFPMAIGIACMLLGAALRLRGAGDGNE